MVRKHFQPQFNKNNDIFEEAEEETKRRLKKKINLLFFIHL